jgi:GDPmannose 4,6-dehydratase
MAFAEVGIELEFSGSKEKEVGKVAACKGEYQLPVGTTVVRVDPRYYRPTEVDLLIGDATKARTKLNWEPSYTLEQLVKEMVASDIECFRKEVILKQSGFAVRNQFE